ncbi:MAG: hypothetical protein ACREA7_09740, partial [Nitrosotalea sp.]
MSTVAKIIGIIIIVIGFLAFTVTTFGYEDATKKMGLSVLMLCFPTYIVNRIIFNFATPNDIIMDRHPLVYSKEMPLVSTLE